MAKKLPKLLTAKEAAEVLGVHIYTVCGYLRSGLITGFKLRTHWRIKSEELDRFIRRMNTSVKDK